MRVPLSILAVFALSASCSKAEQAADDGREERLCTAAEAGAATSAKATELLNAVKQSDSAGRKAACTTFREVLDDGSRARIPDAPGCRWDNRNSNGNPHFLISLHLTQLKGQAREICGDMDR